MSTSHRPDVDRQEDGGELSFNKEVGRLTQYQRCGGGKRVMRKRLSND